ncbi:AAA family ATPase [Hydrogenophaga sp. A37]|uniref:AAA family ATPase n=1 Tax=Hydrogenophaga sp. A37 TaxID=1945864 RepID=UPI00098611E1|nr:AAA family ATPase [Hydrogenophaga sp. A37]
MNTAQIRIPSLSGGASEMLGWGPDTSPQFDGDDYEDAPDESGEDQSLWFTSEPDNPNLLYFRGIRKDGPDRLAKRGAPEHGSEEESSAVDELEPQPMLPIPHGVTPDIPCITSDDFAEVVPVRWLIYELMAVMAVVLWWGAPQSGKTFALINILFCVALGLPWAGRVVERGNVLYVCLEGHTGFKVRVRVAEAERGVSLGDRAQFVDWPVNLMRLEHIHALAKVARKYRIKLIIIDTLSASIAGEGDDSSNKDMARLIHHASLLARMTGATVLITHHTGRDPNASMERGASTLRANVDTSVKVAKLDNQHHWEVVKSRDGPPGICGKFELVPYEYSTNDGEIISSVVVRHLESDGVVHRLKKTVPQGNQATVLAFLEQELVAGPTAEGVPEPSPSIGHEEAIHRCSALFASSEPKHRRTRAKETLSSLVRNGHLLESEDLRLSLPSK